MNLSNGAQSSLVTAFGLLVAIVAIVVFSGKLGWFPSFGMITPDTYTQFRDAPFWRPYLTGDFAMHYLLPFAVIVIRYTYLPLLIMRTSVVETSGRTSAVGESRSGRTLSV